MSLYKANLKMHNKKRRTYPSLACNFNKAYENMPALSSSEHNVCVCVCVCVCVYSLKAYSFYVHGFLSSFVFFTKILYVIYNIYIFLSSSFYNFSLLKVLIILLFFYFFLLLGCSYC